LNYLNRPPAGVPQGEPVRRAATAWPSASARRRSPSSRQGGGLWGSDPKYSKQCSLRAARAGVAALVILEYGNMMRRIIDTKYR